MVGSDVMAERLVTVKAEDGRELRLCYRVFTGRTTMDGDVRECYGLEAVMRDGDRTDSRRFPCITCRREEMEMIFLMVVDGVVFPEELGEILGQIIEEKIL